MQDVYSIHLNLARCHDMGRVRSLKKRRFAEEERDNGGDIDGGLAVDHSNEEDSIVDPGAIRLLQKRRLRQKVGGSCTLACFDLQFKYRSSLDDSSSLLIA